MGEVRMIVEDGALMEVMVREEDVVSGRLAPLRPDLLAVARSIVLDDDEAQDIVQATLEIALRRAAELRSLDSLLPWLLRIETREAFRFTRRAQRVIRLGWHPGPELRDVSTTQFSVEVRDALRCLPDRTRAAVVLHYMADLSVAATAEALGVTENTVKTQLKRGLALLREELRDVC